MRAGITPRMCKNEATESQRQSEAIRGNQRQSEAIRGNQRQSEAIRGNQAAPQALTSGAIRRNQMQSGAIRCNQELCVSVFSCFGRAARACVLCFCVLGWHNGPVFCVFVFWQTPLKTQHGVNCSKAVGGTGTGTDWRAMKAYLEEMQRYLHVWCMYCDIIRSRFQRSICKATVLSLDL